MEKRYNCVGACGLDYRVEDSLESSFGMALSVYAVYPVYDEDGCRQRATKGYEERSANYMVEVLSICRGHIRLLDDWKDCGI